MSRRGLRDTQQSRVYAWENRFFRIRSGLGAGPLSIDECRDLAARIWREERGRYGLARKPAPAVVPGRNGGFASDRHHEIRLGRWARRDHVVLHEVAHLLTPHVAPHGPRFVGVCIGLYARHLGRSADELMALADEMRVKYDRRSVGAVPRRELTNVERLAALLPCSVMAAAVDLDCSYRSIHGYALSLLRAGRARYFRGKLVSLEPRS